MNGTNRLAVLLSEEREPAPPSIPRLLEDLGLQVSRLDLPSSGREGVALDCALEQRVEAVVAHVRANRREPFWLVGTGRCATVAVLAGRELADRSSHLKGIIALYPTCTGGLFAANDIRREERACNRPCPCNTPVLLFLGMDALATDEADIVRWCQCHQSIQAWLSSSSTILFGDDFGQSVSPLVREWLAEQQEEPEDGAWPAAVVFDWDGVLSCAKPWVSTEDCLRETLSSFAARRWAPLPNEWWERDAADRTAPPRTTGSGTLKWQRVIRRAGRMLFPADAEERLRATIDLACEYLKECFKRLEMVYEGRDPKAGLRWRGLAVHESTLNRFRAYVCSGTILEEVDEESRLADPSRAFARVWGYPVRKSDVLSTLADDLRRAKKRICLVDDSIDDVLSAREQGFSAVHVRHAIHRPAGDGGLSAGGVAFDAGGMPMGSFEDALAATQREASESSLRQWAREFLGPHAVVVGRVLKRFGGSPVWRIRREGNSQEAFYCKIVHMSKGDAGQVARALAALAERNLPVATWLPSWEGPCIELAPNRCVVMETALPGLPLSYDALDEQAVTRCACILAELHRALRDVRPRAVTFRASFSSGLDAFDDRLDEFWQLLVYRRYQPTGCLSTSAGGLPKWLDRHGQRVYCRLEQTADQLRDALRARTPQWILGDFNYSNVLFDQRSLTGVVDYEDIHHGPVELDALSYCMFGPRELRFPRWLDVFVRAYCGVCRGALDPSVLPVFARAVANARLVRRVQAMASLAGISPRNTGVRDERDLDELDELCVRLEGFTFHSSQ